MASATPGPVLERDAVKVDPQHYTVELENSQVRVVRIRYNAGEGSVMHQHAPGVAVFLTDGKFKFTYPDGTSEIVEKKAGDVLVFDQKWEHLPENLTGDKFEAVYVEVRG